MDHVVSVHLCVGQYSKEFLQKLQRVNNITPKNYLDFISTYTKLLNQKDKFVLDQCHRLDGGLMKLMEATEQIKVFNETAGGAEGGRHKEVRSMQYSTEGYL